MEFKNKNIFIIGIGGISLSALAMMLKNNGAKVKGSDIHKSRITTGLEQNGIEVLYGHKAQNVVGTDIVIYSAAIHDDNPEFKKAAELKIPMLTRAELLAEIALKYKNVIAVSGSHGKTTTTGMIASCFIDAGLNPTVHIGGELKKINGNVYIGGKDYFISEACEYVDSFLRFKKLSTAVALNVQADHMDYFKTIENLQNSFKIYLNITNKNQVSVINNDDEFLKGVSVRADKITYAINSSADFMAKNLRRNKFSRYSYDLYYKDIKLSRIKLSVTGKHEVYNSLACICVCLHFGLTLSEISMSLERFSGIKRRFEDVGDINGAKVFHDYAHHPTEIQANIKAAKEFTKGRVIAIFQPHTYTRTKSLWNDFINCFSDADLVYFYKIYPARENPIDGVTTENLAKELQKSGKSAINFNNFDDLYITLKNNALKDDTILILGAGNIDAFCEYIK